MMALTSPYLWYTTRATGMVALVLFTLVVTLGTFVANRVGGSIVGRFELNELHRSVSMVAVVFLALHVVTTVVDSFVATGWISIIVPFTSPYKRLAVAIGAIAFDLILAVWVSSLLKVRIKNASWRFIHWFSWLAFAGALAHGFLTGTDGHHGVGLAIVATCGVVVALAAIWRYLGRPTRAAGRTALSPLVAAPLPARAARPGHRPAPPATARPTRRAPGPGRAVPPSPPAPRGPSNAAPSPFPRSSRKSPRSRGGQ
jgi:DMSO/TMAO reductase YedYZ heme-binding membrane subunit